MDNSPFVPANRSLAEMSFRAIVLGAVFAIVFASANIYLGLYAGMTISAAIPAAILSMAILRALGNSTILENTFTQNMASSGESIAAATIYTIPAFLIAGLWSSVDFWTSTLLCVSGGILGVILMVPLRRSHIVEDKTLQYPESVALTEVLKTGESGSGSESRTILTAMVLAGVLKFFSSALLLIKGTVETAFVWGKTAFFLGTDTSPALVGVGYIVGLNISTLMALGGIFAWWIAIPAIGFSRGVTGDPLDWYWEMWGSQIRYIGVGAMMVGGMASIYGVRRTIVSGVFEVLQSFVNRSAQNKILRTDRNLSGRSLALLLSVSLVLLVLGLYLILHRFGLSLLAASVALLMAGFLAAVSSYIVGLVGGSNAPVSGMTICAVLVGGLLLLGAGLKGAVGVAAILGIAAVVCGAVCLTGEMSQQYKAGYWIGATPAKQTWAQLLGLFAACLVVAPILTVLNETYGIGTGGPGSLKAPQATLFASIARALFGEGTLPWNQVALGAGVGVAILIVDKVLEGAKANFRMPIMATAVGMYLPVTLAFPMLIGGLVNHLAKEKGASRGVLFASGLVAGESMMGVVIGAVMYFNRGLLPYTLGESNVLSLLALAGVGLALWFVVKKKV